MKSNKLRFLTLFLAFAVLLGTMTSILSLTAFADETSSDKKDEEVDVWEEKRPAYTNTKFSSVRDRLNGDSIIDPMTLYCVTGGYAFYIDALTGEVIILKLKDALLTKAEILEEGKIPEYTAFYCTNPYTIGSARAVGSTSDASVSEKEKLYAQIFIKYSENDQDKEMNSFVDCAVSDQISFSNIRGGIRVEYTIGREEVTYLVPRMIRTERLENLRDQIKANSTSARDAKTFEAYYQLMDPEEENLPEKSKKEILEKYPITKQFPIYVCETKITATELLRLEKFVRSYTDYDYDQLEADHAETEYTSSDDIPPLFKLALEYRVDGSEIVIRCNAGNIRFDSTMYKLSDVLVLPYGGAGDANNSGYMLSPDGSGALIRFSDLSSSFTSTTNLYGQDYTYHSVTGSNAEVARIPAFGVYQRVEGDSTRIEKQDILDENGEPVYDDEGNVKQRDVEVPVALEIAYLAVIESGDSLAKVNITYGGALHNFASIYTSFNPRPKDSYKLDGGISAGSNALWTVESKRKYTGDYKIRLFILDGTEDGDVPNEAGEVDKSYSDMAAAYRNYLIRTGVLVENPYVTDDIPLYIETLGAIETTERFAGIPYKTTTPLTSFEDTKTMITELQDQGGVNNISIVMKGWYNGGLKPKVATSIKVEDALGGSDGFKDLVAFAKERGVTLFPDIELSFAYSDEWFDGFDESDDLSQTIDDRGAMLSEYDPITQTYTSSATGIISPYFIKNTLYKKAYEDYKEFNVGNIGIGSIGKYLCSDFNSDNPLTREDSKELMIQLLAEVAEGNDRILVNSGNEYTLEYATDIVNISLDDSRYSYSYSSVPFMSMVLHGCKNYAGSAINLAGDYNYQILSTIESGASPYYVLAYQNTSEIKSSMPQYYSIRYQIWKSDIANAYATINNALRDVQKAFMSKHEVIDDHGNVVHVTYSNGISFYVNYGIEDYVIEDTETVIPAGSFIKYSASGEQVMIWEG